MANKWNTAYSKMSPQARARVEARVTQTLESLPLAEIRKAVGLTQVELSGRLDLAQGNVSKIENSADMYITTLRKYIEALGGELYLTATFPDGRTMHIDQLAAIAGK